MTQRLACLLLVLVLAATGGCAWFGNKEPPDGSENVRRLYERAQRQLMAGNYSGAIAGLENLTAVFPFSEEARQAQLDLMYAYWRNEEPDSAIAAADRFMLENPTHPRVDYALYMKGLARFPSDPGPLERLFRVDMDKRPPGEMQASFNAFAQLLQQHPESDYVEDARQRMVYLRNRLAAHEVAVAEFYYRRHGYVAAINRARHVLETYQETDSARQALDVMARSYEKLGLTELAEDARRVLAANESVRRR
jgi:outer membrane protein assembly factor BamD